LINLTNELSVDKINVKLINFSPLEYRENMSKLEIWFLEI